MFSLYLLVNKEKFIKALLNIVMNIPKQYFIKYQVLNLKNFFILKKQNLIIKSF